jgi:ABC-type uncharacterized transport system auxiliary subunit
LYRLRPAPAAVSASTDGAATVIANGGATPDASIVVETYETPGMYGDPQIVYRTDGVRYGTYPNREWALPLGTMLATLTAETLRQDPATGGHVREGTSHTQDAGWSWRGTVREFEEVNRDGGVYAAVRLEAALVRVADDSVLWQGSARLERPVVPPNVMSAVVDSLSASASTVVRELTQSAMPAVRAAATARRAAAAAPASPR